MAFRLHPSFLARVAVVVTGALAAAPAVGSAARLPQPPRGVGQSAVGHVPSIVRQLGHIVTIGSTVDPMNGDQNPYGLAIAPVTAGKMTAGDLVVCNFNDGLNIQGLGRTIEVLHPTPGSKPARLVADDRLTGCNAISMTTTADFPWVAALDANDNPVYDPSGTLVLNLAGNPLASPWGQTFSGTRGFHGVAAFYESNAFDGSIVRINITKYGAYTMDKIATGFSVNHGVPGTILAPSGLTYDAARDVLYIVDSNVNRVVAFSKPGMIPVKGIVVNGSGFGGPAAAMAHVLFAGAPLRAPISSALLFNGNLVVGNTSNNKLIELTPAGHVVGEKLLDAGAAGALFGIAATGTSVATTKIYFNDDNDNTVKVLQQ
jgi:hypothetical protein